MVIINGEFNSLGKYLRKVRHGRELTLEALSALSKVSTTHIARVERGDRFPSAHVLQKIADPLGFSELELLKLAGYLHHVPATSPNGRITLDDFVSYERKLGIKDTTIALELIKQAEKLL